MTRLGDLAESEGLVLSYCRRCSKQIIWAKTEAGKPIPLDLRHTPRGKWLVEVIDGLQVARYLSDAEKEERGGHWLRRPHLTKCKPDTQSRLV